MKDGDDPADDWSDGPIVPSDDTVYTTRPRSIVVLGDGNLVMVSTKGNTLTLAVTASPDPLPYRPAKVMAATTASIAFLY